MSSTPERSVTHPLWMTLTLRLIGGFDLLLGAAMIALPGRVGALAGVAGASSAVLFQAIGLYVVLLAGYLLIAANDPARHWPAPALSLAAKMMTPALVLTAGGNGADSLWFLVPADLIWWLPLAVILWTLIDEASRESARLRAELPPTAALIETATTQTGATLRELTNTRPQLVVFLRHFGCTFCREAMADLVDRRHDIEAHGLGIVLIHMSDETAAAAFLEHYGLDDLPRISDPAQTLYRAARLHRGSALQLFGPKVWWRAVAGGLLLQHGVGRLLGDGFQMPGAFVLHHGEVLYAFRHRSAADRPDYLELARCGIAAGARNAA